MNSNDLSPPDALLGQVLDDRYRLDALLGTGGMGAVYRAHHLGLARDVAVKLLHPEIGSDAAIGKRFDREAQSASRLDHPNCVRVDDFGTTAAGVKYLVMELLVGRELGDAMVMGSPWPVDATLAVLEDILAGLEHAHHCGIVHRDLKPENVFMVQGPDGRERAKLVDFGIAKLLDADGAAEVLTRAGMVFGTPRFMSPEQAAGGKVDERSDLYAVGVLAFNLLAGAPPFDGEELAAVLRMQIMAPPPPLPESVPEALAAFVGQLLEKSRHDRPPSATAALATITALRATGGRSLAPAASPSEPPAGVPSPISTTRDLPAEPSAMVGETLASRYRLDALLGIGGMGAVLRAFDGQTQAVVAAKILHTALSGDPEIQARFQREAETASRLQHPNIVPVLDYAVTDDTPYLIMPLLEGAELRAITGQPLDPQRAQALFAQLLDALAYAHAHGVVHRDLKPENLFVIRDQQGHECVQLVDFGLVKITDGSAGPLTRFGQVFGTPAYMSPEQAQGRSVDARTDLYAAGIILYELLTGRPPFVAMDPVALVRMHLNDEPAPLPESVPLPMRQLVTGLLAKAPDERIPDADTAQKILAGTLAWAPMPAPDGASPLPAPDGPAPDGPAAKSSTMSAFAATASNPVLTQPRVPQWLIYTGCGGGMVLLLLFAIALWPHDKDGDPGQGEAGDHRAAQRPAAKPGGGSLTKSIRPKPDEDTYVAIDRAITGKRHGEAMDLIRQAKDKFPDDPGLLWREGRTSSSGDQSERTTALHRYAEALTGDPSLGEDTVFQAELRGLLRDPKLRETAIDLAVRELGGHGLPFLLELVNDSKLELGYVDRHRVLDVLVEHPAEWAKVDPVRQRSLDLSQARQAPAPCTAFAEGLDAIAKAQDPKDLPALYRRSTRIPNDPGSGESAADCEGLDAKLEATRGLLANRFPEQAAALSR